MPTAIAETLLVLNITAALLGIASVLMKGMIKLRLIAVGADALEFASALASLSWVSVGRFMVTLPVNWLRFYEMLRLVKRSEIAATGDLSMDWLKPFMEIRPVKAGEVLFRRGDKADQMFLVDAGKFRLMESGMAIGPGQVVGEIGLLTPGNTRTQGFMCEEAGAIYEIDYESVRELYFQNPEFGFYFLTLTSRRLLENIARLEAELERRPPAPESRPAGLAPLPA
jgi:CRP/FNR family cyclic AMP-dependent transcriptional regulator